MPLEQSLVIYGPNIIATLLSSVALALLGSQLSSRSESLQAFVASQSASLGITVGLALLILLSRNVEDTPLLPIILAFIFSSFSYFLAQKLCSLFRSKSTEILIAAFLFSLSLNYLITAALPHLESHFSAAFMGDIATASANSSYWLAILSLCGMCFFLLRFRQLSLQSFWIASSNVTRLPGLKILFYLAAALLIVESTRIFGFLYTSASLTVAPLAASLVARNLKTFVLLTLCLSSISSCLGFILSLYSSQFSTSASIVSAQVILSSLAILVLSTRKHVSIRT